MHAKHDMRQTQIGALGASRAWAFMPIIRAALSLSAAARRPPSWWSMLPCPVNWDALVEFYEQDFQARSIKKEHLPWRSPASSFAFLVDHHAEQLLSPKNHKNEAEEPDDPAKAPSKKKKTTRKTRKADSLVYQPSRIAKTTWNALLGNFDHLARQQVYRVHQKLRQQTSR